MEYLVFLFTFYGSWHTLYFVLLNHSTILTDFNVVIDGPLFHKSKPIHNSSIIIPKKINFQFPTLDDSSSFPIAQSQKCSAQELKLSVQCFKEIPLTDYFVLINDSVIISCIVNNQHGKVQWRAKNLVLGYDRSVPGMPRIQIVGDVTKGEHNLQITNVQPEDSGDYECQVQPVEHHPLLRRSSTLHVTKLPSLPLILYQKEIIRNSEIIIDFNLHIKKMLKLLCVSHGGIPPPIFHWYWNSREIITDDMEFIQVTNTIPNQSTLIMPISFLKSGHHISCVTKNKATDLLEARTKNSVKLFEIKVSIIMFVQSGQPIIQNRINVLSEQDNIELICILKPTGHPKATLKWQVQSTNTRELKHNYKTFYNEKNDELKVILKLENVNRLDHRLNVSCICHNKFNSKFTPFQIFVKHMPKSLSIATFNGNINNLIYKSSQPDFQMHNHMATINGIENDFVNIVCFTSSYFGSLNMKWVLQHGHYLDGSKSIMQILSPLVKLNHNITHNDTVQTFITQKIKLKRFFNSGFIECQAVSESQETMRTKMNFNVYYAPKISIITGYVSQFPVHEGDTIQLTCCAYSGNPTPTIRWYKNNSVVIISNEAKNDKDELNLVFLHRVFKLDNGQRLFCEARSDVGVEIVTSNSITINVIFPPSNVEIFCTNCSPDQIIINKTNEFLCESSSSNPGSIIIWKLFNCSTSDIRDMSNCSTTILPEILSTNLPGQYNGWKSQSRLNLRLDYRQDKFILQCLSRLSHKMLADRYKPSFKNIRLRVLYPPLIVEKLQSPNIIEGSTLRLEFKILANPHPYKFAWYFNKRLISEHSLLVIENVQFNYSGKYIFTVTNSLGNATAFVVINIQYRPRIHRTSINISKTKALLSCEASMNPFYDNSSSVWKRVEALDRLSYTGSSEMEPILSVKYSCKSILSSNVEQRINSICNFNGKGLFVTKLIIFPYQDSDFGWYQCSVDNGVGQVGFEVIHLNLPIKPWYLKISQYSKQGGDISHNSLLTCCFLSHVRPTIFWNFPFSNNLFPSSNISEIRPSTFCGWLQIYVENDKYFGQYGCQAKNEKGKSRLAHVLLQPTFPPDFPESFKLVKVYQDEIRVSWIKGSNGGTAELFQLRWKEVRQKPIYHYKTMAGNQSSETASVTISNFSSGNYVIDIGVNSVRYPNFRYCCAMSFVILPTQNGTKINNKPQTHIEDPDVNIENLNYSIYYIIIASSIVVFLTLIFALIIFVCVMKHRRKSIICLQNRNKTGNVECVLKLSDIPKENKNVIDNVDIVDDIQLKMSSPEHKELLIDQEAVKFLTPVSQLSLFNCIPLSCPNIEIQKSFINEFTPRESISHNVTLNSHSPVSCQGIYGRFMMEKLQNCDCHLAMKHDGIILMTNQ